MRPIIIFDVFSNSYNISFLCVHSRSSSTVAYARVCLFAFARTLYQYLIRSLSLYIYILYYIHFCLSVLIFFSAALRLCLPMTKSSKKSAKRRHKKSVPLRPSSDAQDRPLEVGSRPLHNAAMPFRQEKTRSKASKPNRLVEKTKKKKKKKSEVIEEENTEVEEDNTVEEEKVEKEEYVFPMKIGLHGGNLWRGFDGDEPLQVLLQNFENITNDIKSHLFINYKKDFVWDSSDKNNSLIECTGLTSKGIPLYTGKVGNCAYRRTPCSDAGVVVRRLCQAKTFQVFCKCPPE